MQETDISMRQTAPALGPTFDEYIAQLREMWTQSLPAETAAQRVKVLMERLLQESSPDEPWIRDFMAEAEQLRLRKLYEDPDFGFIQMVHYHRPGHSRPPHDHGPHWVVYGVYRGEIEIPTYRRDASPVDAEAGLDRLGSVRITAGTAHTYLPGEIHSTQARSDDGAIVLRFLSADLAKARVSRYKWEQIAAA
jgi:predicted metal-dependent enzyme (double-stranded beta helix superfamily)